MNDKMSGLTVATVAEGDKWRLTMSYRCGSFCSEVSELHYSTAGALLSSRWHIENTFKAYLR